jgi:hypothetical protein
MIFTISTGSENKTLIVKPVTSLTPRLSVTLISEVSTESEEGTKRIVKFPFQPNATREGRKVEVERSERNYIYEFDRKLT